MNDAVSHIVTMLADSEIPGSTDALLQQILDMLQGQKTEYKTHTRLPKTAVFVDYENWCIALQKEHRRTPNIQAWFDDVKLRGDIAQLTFFGDLSESGGLSRHIDRVREFSNDICDTRSGNLNAKKDVTDFIMCAQIFQAAMSFPEIEQIILFTGDSHFSSVASYLKNYHQKTIGIYGIKGCTSRQLQNIASWVVELPFDTEHYADYKIALLRSLKRCEERSMKPSFMGTIDHVARYTGYDWDLLKDMMRQLFDEGILYSIEERNQNQYASKKMRQVVKVHWSFVPEHYKRELERE